MGLADYEVFIRERLGVWDSNLDLTEGSPIDTQVIQPLLRRLGTDPFTVDASTFIVERLTQEFPDLATTDGDAVSDLLAKPALLLWDPIIREIQRVKNMLSFRDPSILTVDEAEALGANIFSERDRGNFSRGVMRVYYAQPQSASITQANFATSRSGLHFFPQEVQSIRTEEMILNVEGELYYFDVNLVAEKAGDEYNIGPGELVTIANVPAAIRVVNKSRFRFGLPEQDAETFIGAIGQDLTERSLVTLRGVDSKISKSFPEVTRLAVVGFNDPEMQRDVLSGGSLGPVIAAGTDASSSPDGEFKPLTRRLVIPSANFFTDVGPTGASSGYVLTLFNMFSGVPNVRDLEITKVINNTTVEVASQSLIFTSGKPWTLRKKELNISGIPGGILFPNTVDGTMNITPDKVHIGGCTDVLVRGADFDTASLVIDVVADDTPALSGSKCDVSTGVAKLGDLVLGTSYQVDDATYVLLNTARLEQYSFEIQNGVAAGVYRVLNVVQTPGQSPALTLDPAPPIPVGNFRWRLLDTIEIDLVEPKETRVSGTTGVMIQDQLIFSASPAIDFDALGVSVGDILRIENGANKSDRIVEQLTPPFFTQIQVDKPFTASQSGATFTIFRSNKAGGVKRPLVRITSIDLLDTSGQPVGTTIPYAKPVEVLSRSFQNPGAGEKVTSLVGVLGIVSVVQPLAGFNSAGGTIDITWDGGPTIAATITAGLRTAAQVVADLNAASQIAVSKDIAAVVSYNSRDYVGIIPLGANTRTTTPSTEHATLFGDTTVRTSRDVRTTDAVVWTSVSPTIDADLDALWVRDGYQVGFYSDLGVNYTPGTLGVSTALRVSYDFAPELIVNLAVGARSLGSARAYFLEPTSMEIDQTSRFKMMTSDGVELAFKPDPTLRFEKIPALPNGKKPHDGATGAGNNDITSVSNDFLKKGIRVGDIVIIDYVPMTGSVALADPVPSLAFKNLILSLDNQADKTITFVSDVATPNAVSRDAVAKQINTAVGLNIASISEVTPGSFHLVFDPEVLLLIRPQNGAPNEANTLLGFSDVSVTNNLSQDAGERTVVTVAPGSVTTKLILSGAAFIGTNNQQFKVLRRGGQRICSTQMANNKAEASLYYWDIELVSEGAGDLWNIDADKDMTASSYRSDGYFLESGDDNLTFSTDEKVKINFSRSILDVGVDDDPENATQLTGQSVSINYEYSSVVGNVQSFISSDTERVINQSPLSRHLVPHFVRFDLVYSGGSKPAEITPDLESYVRDVEPNQAIESSDIQALVSGRGATSIQNPIDLLAVVHNFDRTVTLARSQNSLTTTRLAAFIPDILNVTRRSA